MVKNIYKHVLTGSVYHVIKYIIQNIYLFEINKIAKNF